LTAGPAAACDPAEAAGYACRGVSLARAARGQAVKAVKC
jgi:hypothetical protein